MFFRIWGLLNSAIVMYIYGPMCLHYIFCCDESFFCQRAIFEFRYAHCFNKYLNKCKTQEFAGRCIYEGKWGTGFRSWCVFESADYQ